MGIQLLHSAVLQAQHLPSVHLVYRHLAVSAYREQSVHHKWIAKRICPEHRLVCGIHRPAGNDSIFVIPYLFKELTIFKIVIRVGKLVAGL